MQATTLLVKSDQYMRVAKYATTKINEITFSICIRWGGTYYSCNMPGNVIISPRPYFSFGLQSKSIPVQVFVQIFLFSPLVTKDSSECEKKTLAAWSAISTGAQDLLASFFQRLSTVPYSRKKNFQ